MMKRLKLSLLVIAIMVGFTCVSLLLIQCNRKSSQNIPDKLILIVVDTLRADRLGCYGYPAAETGSIDQMAFEGALFFQTISAIPETGPSVSSILTGLYPHSHGVRSNVYSLPNKTVTLAQILKKQGFKTAAFTDTFPFRKQKILRGFDYFQKREHGLSSQEEIISSAVSEPVSWMKNNKDDNFFALIHFYDPHLPYTPIQPSQRTLSLNYSGPFTGEWGPAMTLWDNRLTADENDVRNMASLYDDEISMVDQYVGEILEEVKKMGIENQTLVVFTADHGEAFGEHNYYLAHGDLLYENQVRVRLILKC